MPRKVNLSPARKQYSRDLKRRVVHQAFTLSKTTTEIAIDLDMPLRVVQRILTNWREIGDVCKDRTCMGRAPLMSQSSVKLMIGLLERCPDIYLDEIQEQLEEQHNVVISLATICRTLRRLGITSKKLSRAAQECCEEARRVFTIEIGGEPPERYSILPAIATKGLIYEHIKVGSYNGDEFLQWLEGLLVIMNPYPAPLSVLILDNCRIHHVEGVAEMCQERGVKLVYLPPYSPDLNPIEECFSFIKHYIRRHGQNFRDAVELGDDAAPFSFLYGALNEVTESHAQGWFKHSGYM